MGLEVSMKSLALRVVLTIGLKLQIQTAQNKNEKITKKFAVLFICLKKKITELETCRNRPQQA